MNTATPGHQPALRDVTSTPTVRQIGRLGDAETRLRWDLAEICLHRAASEILQFRPDLRLLFIGEDDEGVWTPIGVSSALELRDVRMAESIEEYEQIESACERAGELANLVAELTGFEDVFAPFVVAHDENGATCSLDLRGIFADALQRHA